LSFFGNDDTLLFHSWVSGKSGAVPPGGDVAEDRVERRLAAILAGDVANYSGLMGVDEEGTLRQLKAHRKELVDPKITEHRGRIVKTTGDGMLVEFVSVVDAVRCAVDIQRGMAERNTEIPRDRRIEFRMGINVGDIISDADDIYGDGVNVAARLEALSAPGGICVSRVVHDQVRDKLSFAFEDMGEQTVKNIARPIAVHRILVDAAQRQAAPSSAEKELVLPDKPSIAVLPFQNMSGDAEQEYFTDGIVEEIITALSRMRWLFVIARNSSFTYKGRSVDVKQVGRELGVRYVLEGSVRKAGSRLRITGQLIDTATGTHLWADRFDGGIEDVFELQDRITESVIGAIAPKLEQAEIERAKRKPTESLDAYDYYLRGLASLYRWTKEGVSEALEQLNKAIALDPDFASAYGVAAWCYFWRRVNGWMVDSAQETAESVRLANRAAELGKDDAVALTFGGFALGYVSAALETGVALIDRALVLNPNMAAAWSASGILHAFLGHHDVAIERLERAMRLSPLDPLMYLRLTYAAMAHLLAGRYDEASALGKKACHERPNFLAAIRVAAVSNAFAGRVDRARAYVGRALELDPDLRISNLKDRFGRLRPQDFAVYVEGLRKAGLPE
jgi:adenylate cyclase